MRNQERWRLSISGLSVYPPERMGRSPAFNSEARLGAFFIWALNFVPTAG